MPSGLGTGGSSATKRPTDLNKRGFASRFASDIKDIGVMLPRALLGMAGAVGSDTVMRAGRAVVPGGSTGFDYGSQSWDQIVKPVGESFINTGALLGTAAASPFSADARDRMGEFGEEASANPGFFLIEHLGNLAIGGSIAAQPLKAGARQAAGAGARASVEQGLKGGAGRAANRAQIAEIASSGGPGAGLAKAGQISGDLVGHPYRAAGRGLRDTHLPNIGALRSGEGYVPNSSAGEVLSQVRETTPGTRMFHTPDMQDAATMRGLRDTSEHLSNRLGEAEAGGNTGLADRLRVELEDARSQVSSFEAANAERLPVLESQRLAPKPLDELSSPVARTIREGLNAERMQQLTAPVSGLVRQTRGMVQDLKRSKTDNAFDKLTVRDPGARRTLAIRQIRDLADSPEVGPALEAAGIDTSVLGGALSSTDDAALLSVLQQIAGNPELRASLPRLESTLDLSILDAYERTAGLPDGSLRNQLYEDSTLTPAIADTLRDVNRLSRGGEDTVTLYRGMAEELDLSRIEEGGTRFTEDLDYALSNTNAETHPYLYEVEVPRDRLLSSDFDAALGGDGKLPHALLNADDAAGARLIDPADARARKAGAETQDPGAAPWWDPQGSGQGRPSERPMEQIAQGVDRLPVKSVGERAGRMLQDARANPSDHAPLLYLRDELAGAVDELRVAASGGDEAAARGILRRYEDARAALEQLEDRPRNPYRFPNPEDVGPVEQGLAGWMNNRGLGDVREAFHQGDDYPHQGPEVATARAISDQIESSAPTNHPLHRYLRPNMVSTAKERAVDWSAVKPGQVVDMPLESWTDNPHSATLTDFNKEGYLHIELAPGAKGAQLSEMVGKDLTQREWLTSGKARVVSVDDGKIMVEMVESAQASPGAQARAGLSPASRAAVDDALGQAYRIPDEQLDVRVRGEGSNVPEPVQAAYQRALEQFTKEAADREVMFARYGIGEPEQWAFRAVKEGDDFRPMGPGENPDLLATPSSKQARKLKSLGRGVTAARSRLAKLTEHSLDTNTAGKAGAYDAHKRATAESARLARAAERAARTGDVELAASLRKQLDTERARAATHKTAARQDIATETRAAQRALEGVVKAISDDNLPIGASDALAMEVRGLTDQLTTLFNDADFTPPARLSRVLADLEIEGIGTNVADTNLLENVVRSLEVDPQVASQWKDSAESARAAVSESRQARFNTRTMEPLIRAEQGARVEARKLRTLERRLDTVDGRLGARDLDAMDAARIRAEDSAALVAKTAEDVGLSSKGGGKAVAERLMREQVRARIKESELARADRSLDRMEQKFADMEAELLNSIDAAPAVARPVLQVGRALNELDTVLRAEGNSVFADQLNLQGVPQTLQAMEDAGVSPTFMRRLEERVAAQGHRASQEGPVRVSKMGSEKRREMGDMEVRRDVDRIKAEQDIELGSRVLGGEMVDDFLTRFGRKNEQIAQSLIEEGKLNKEAWRDMSKKQREKVLQDAGYNQYQPGSIFGFRVRNTSPDGDWIPTHLNNALEEFSKSGMLEKVLTQAVGPATTTWKHFLLALRPAWQVNNVVGNALMMTVAGEMSPSGYAKFMAPGSEAHTMLRHHRLGWDMEQGFGLTKELSRDLLDTGLSRDLLPNQKLRAKLSDALVEPEAVKGLLDSGIAGKAGMVGRGFSRVTGASYRLNAFMDNLNRSAMYLDNTLNQGLSPEVAVARANKVIGDYTTMNHFEQVYVRTAFPFYAWMRHITKLSADMLAPDSITKAVVFGNVVQTLGQPNGMEEGFPEYMAGDVIIPGTDKALGMRQFNPWADVTDPLVYNGKISTRGSMRSMHPLAQFTMERWTGVDTLTGRPFSTPLPELDDLGREVPTAPSLGRHAFNKFAPPQAVLGEKILRSATSQAGARYASGDPVLIEGARDPSIAGGLASFAGAPLRSVDLDGIQQRRDAAYDQGSRKLERYTLELQEYQERRQARTLPQKLTPFGQ